MVELKEFDGEGWNLENLAHDGAVEQSKSDVMATVDATLQAVRGLFGKGWKQAQR